jgi:hypothetical protein
MISTDLDPNNSEHARGGDINDAVIASVGLFPYPGHGGCLIIHFATQ